MPRKQSLPPLTDEQLQALRDYAAAVGPKWKWKLNIDWARAGTDVYEIRSTDRYHLLQQVRNTHGPSWLAGFVFKD